MIFIQPSISPVFLSLGYFDFRWYSLAYIFAFKFGSIFIKKLNKNSYYLLSEKQIDSFFVWSIIGVIIGGRVGYVLFYQTNLFFSDPFYILEIWNGGMSFHGGLIGMILSIYLFSIKKNIRFFYLSDLVSLVAPIGLFFGRIANFINSELYGKVTDAPWGIIFSNVDNIVRHPSQIYEAFLEGFLLFLLLNFFAFRKKLIFKHGLISGLFLTFYSLFRFISEFFREPDVHVGYLYLGTTMGQVLSLIMLFCGLILISILIEKKNEL